MLKDFFTRKKYATIAVQGKPDIVKPIENKKVETVNKVNTSYDKIKDSRINPRKIIEDIIDEDTFIEFDVDLEASNPLDFPDYKSKIALAKDATKEKEAVISGEGDINGERAIICVMNPSFMMGSMGTVVGEKITRATEKAIEKRLPLIIFSASGGARMQEGILSLMQMAKTSAALARLNESGQLYISVLTDPTTGGVTASFAMLGDIILAEPGALIGFAGPRVIEQTIKQKLPEGFQRAEFLLEKGFIDKIVKREDMKDTLSKILRLHSKGGEVHD
ncbi:MAG: acetyl-CoA carboxylase carboxyltransferase subunit beta [Tissierellia bacterium]|nr:acetyl-CoA carboxylase carboxyltransferase subunit beta [Tissierellia bacterium]